MTDPYALIKEPRMVYGFFDDHDKLVYIGSSHLPIEKLEDNHRKAFEYWPKKKHGRFRSMLKAADRTHGTFKALVEIKCTRPTIERIEGQMIRAIKPFYNDDMDPVASSKHYERY